MTQTAGRVCGTAPIQLGQRSRAACISASASTDPADQRLEGSVADPAHRQRRHDHPDARRWQHTADILPAHVLMQGDNRADIAAPRAAAARSRSTRVRRTEKQRR